MSIKTRMSFAAKLYISTIVILGAIVAISELIAWQSHDLVRFCSYLALAILASRLKVALPAITGSLSVLFIFILFGIVELSPPEALSIGCVAVFIQCFWDKRPKWHQVAFNVGSMAIAITVTGNVYHSQLVSKGQLNDALMLVVSATVFFAMNTFPVAAAIALTERRSLRQVSRECYFWSLPYYLLGAVIVGATNAITRNAGWQTALLAVPVVYLVYRAYSLYLGRIEEEKKHAEEMADLHLRTIEALALAIEAKDYITHDHLQRVQRFAV